VCSRSSYSLGIIASFIALSFPRFVRVLIFTVSDKFVIRYIIYIYIYIYISTNRLVRFIRSELMQCVRVCRCSKSRFLQYICTSSRNVIRRPFYCFRELMYLPAIPGRVLLTVVTMATVRLYYMQTF